MGEPFEISRFVDLAVPPERAFRAVTAESAAWMFPMPAIEPQEGAFGPRGWTTAWEPPSRAAIRTDGDEGWFNALEFDLEATGDGCRLTYVHTGVFLEGWDTQYDAASQHTDFYLSTLRSYLRHFADDDMVYVGTGSTGLQAPEASARPGGFARIRGALDLAGRMRPGAPVDIDVANTPGLHGHIDYMTERFIGVRTDEALYRFFGRDAWGMPVAMSGHVVSDAADVALLMEAWQSWLDLLYL